MTVPISKPEKASDKEKLVATDVAAILPTRVRLVRSRKQRFFAKLLISITILFLIFVGIFLTVCYLRHVGPFHRVFNGYCMVGRRQYNGNKPVYESYEITDDYLLMNIPRFNHISYRMEAVKTLHVFRARLTVIQMGYTCFIKPMDMRFNHRNWYSRLQHMKSRRFRMDRYRYNYLGYKMQKPMIPNAHRYLHHKVHHIAAAMCVSRSVYRLVPIRSRNRCPPLTRECQLSTCAEKVYKKQNGCKVCVCKRHHSIFRILLNRAFMSRPRVVKSANKTKSENAEVYQGQRLNSDIRLDNDPQQAPPQPLNDFVLKNSSRHKRSVNDLSSCKKIGNLFEGISPISESNVFVDTVYDC